HACYGFLSLWIRNTKVSENADMAKTWATKCCPGTYKNNYQLCCGIKVLLKLKLSDYPKLNILFIINGCKRYMRL
ncbi:hypothetical protein, partial [Phocaeicola sp.]|uniref:hypothetical protein n=1 Tax=Phocaeicola sp. TaxID=2773926 RepID=UPI003A8FEF53